MTDCVVINYVEIKNYSILLFLAVDVHVCTCVPNCTRLIHFYWTLVKYPHVIPSEPAYGVYISHLIKDRPHFATTTETSPLDTTTYM